MTHITLLEQKDMPLWDEFVRTHPCGTIYHLAGWKDALEKSFKHIQGYIIALRDEASQKILAGLPAYTVRSVITGNRIVSIPFASLCDPLVSSPEEMEMLLPPLIHLSQQCGASHIEIRTTKATSLVRHEGFNPSHFYKHHYLVLDRNPEELKKTFHKKAVRAPIRKAEENSLELRIGTSKTDLAVFYRLLSKSRRKNGLPVMPFRFFETLWAVFTPSQKLVLLFAAHNGMDVAVSMLMKFKETVIVEFGCDLIEFRRLYPNHFLDWKSIQLAYSEGYKIFSFGRTSPQNTGLMTYKNRWGTTVESLSQFHYPESFSSIGEQRESSWKYKMMRTVLRKVPPPIFNMIGDFVYRHMG
jgi:CelD/BcsL family acetyltransferase involved in cellulose biosynthesis